MSRTQLSEDRFAELLSIVSSEIETVFITFHSYETLNRLALDDPDILTVLNEDGDFWQMHRGTLLVTLFMTASRIFDPVAAAITVQSLVSATLANLHLFSKVALRARRSKSHPNAPWLDDFIHAAWQPSNSSDLRYLQKSLNPHVSRFTNVYLPIRNNIYGHRLMTDDQAAAQLFPKTNREELKDTVHFLRDLQNVIWNLYNNGQQPVLGKCDHAIEAKAIAAHTENVLRKLAKHPR